MTANQIKAAEVFERKRSNLVNESLGRNTLTETGRHNRAVESINRDTLTETGRHNRVTERETQRHNVRSESNEATRNAEVARHNRASEDLGYSNVTLGYANLDEQNRHNVNTEIAGYMNAGASMIGSVAKTVDAFIPL